MAGNSFISNFKAFPRAAVVAAAIIICLEMGSWAFLQMLRSNDNKQDLARLRGFFSKPLAGLSRDVPADPRYACRKYQTVNDMAQHGPYDVIVIGSSVAETEWVEMLRLDYGYAIGVSLLEAVSKHFLSKFVPVIKNYLKINNNREAILLWVDITERDTRDFKLTGDLDAELREYGHKRFNLQKWLALPTKALFFYCEQRIESMYNPEVKTINIDGRDELFYFSDVNGLKKKVEFNPEDRLRLSGILKDYKEAAEASGCIFAMAAFPTKPQQYEWILNRESGTSITGRRDNLKALEMAAKENNIPFLDLEEELEPVAEKIYAQDKRLLWNRAESHMNAEGNRYIARIVAEFLKEISSVFIQEKNKGLEKQVK